MIEWVNKWVTSIWVSCVIFFTPFICVSSNMWQVKIQVTLPLRLPTKNSDVTSDWCCRLQVHSVVPSELCWLTVSRVKWVSWWYTVKSGGGEGGGWTIHAAWNIDIHVASYSKSSIMAWKISTKYNSHSQDTHKFSIKWRLELLRHATNYGWDRSFTKGLCNYMLCSDPQLLQFLHSWVCWSLKNFQKNFQTIYHELFRQAIATFCPKTQEGHIVRLVELTAMSLVLRTKWYMYSKRKQWLHVIHKEFELHPHTWYDRPRESTESFVLEFSFSCCL